MLCSSFVVLAASSTSATRSEWIYKTQQMSDSSGSLTVLMTRSETSVSHVIFMQDAEPFLLLSQHSCVLKPEWHHTLLLQPSNWCTLWSTLLSAGLYCIVSTSSLVFLLAYSHDHVFIWHHYGEDFVKFRQNDLVLVWKRAQGTIMWLISGKEKAGSVTSVWIRSHQTFSPSRDRSST